MKVDGVFEGGGVKGIGLAGAVCSIEEAGYSWVRLAGTSSGSIVAALLAAGYSGKELKKILSDMDYKKLLDKSGIQRIPLLGEAIGVLHEKGIYDGNAIENWVRGLLEEKGKTKFKDVYINGESRLKIIASDITKQNMMILPDDLVSYGIDPKEFDIAKAVRMSISIPFYFKPVKLTSGNNISFIVDGGVSSNFPIWIFDVAGVPRWPTFGFKLVEPKISRAKLGKIDTVSYISDIIDTMVNRREDMFIRDKDSVRIVSIPTLDIKTTEFSLSKEKSDKLFQSGYTSGKKFIEEWNFDQYIETFRKRKVMV